MKHFNNLRTKNINRNRNVKKIPLEQKEQVQFLIRSTPTPADASEFTHRSNPGKLEEDTIRGSTTPAAHLSDPKFSTTQRSISLISTVRSINPSFECLPTKLSLESSVPPLGKLGS